MSESQIMIPDDNAWQNVILQDYGCFYAEYENNIKPIFYIKPELWSKLLESYDKVKHRVYNTVNSENDYILRLPNCEISNLSVPRETLQQMIYDGHPVENIDIPIFTQKYNDQFDYITEEYMRKSIEMVNYELDQIKTNLEYNDIIQYAKDHLDEISDFSSSEDDEK